MEKTKKIPSKPVGKCKKKIIIAVSATAVALITLLTLALTLGWFAPADGATKEGYSETNKKDLWEASYTLLDGTLEKEFRAEGGKTLTIEFETTSGEMDLMVYDKDTGYAYIDDMPTNFVCVGNGVYEIPFSVDVVVKLTAREHEGRFYVKAE